MTSILLFTATVLSFLHARRGLERRDEIIVLASVKCPAKNATRSSKEKF
jgi:hypothetical protein